MKNILIGNGVNIVCGGTEHTNKEIILRTIEFCKADDFPNHIIVDDPILAIEFLGRIYMELPDILSGKYDRYAVSSHERQALEDVKTKYGNNSRLIMTDIGFEDYYFLYDMVCRKYGIHNPDRYFVRETIKKLFLHGIYNGGKVNKVYESYPEKFCRYLEAFENIFTTNYDSNLESATGHDVYHLHGAFSCRADVYNPDSPRNRMADAPIKDFDIDTDYEYLYSNALTDYCGANKEFSMKQGVQANSAIDNLCRAYMSNPEIKKQIDSWEMDSNSLVRKMAEAVKIKLKEPGIRFTEGFSINAFETMEGELVILGLSSANDTHLFRHIDGRSKITGIEYYYFSEQEKTDAESVLSEHVRLGQVKFSPVQDFWRDMK